MVLVGEDGVQEKNNTHTVLVRTSVEDSAGLFVHVPGDKHDRKQSKC